MGSGVLGRGIVVALRLQIAVVRGPTRIVELPRLMSEGGGLFVVRGAAAQCIKLSVYDSGSDNARACVEIAVELLENGGVGGSWD